MRFTKSSPRKIIENFGDRRGAFADLYRILTMDGLRAGEALGLQW